MKKIIIILMSLDGDGSRRYNGPRYSAESNEMIKMPSYHAELRAPNNTFTCKRASLLIDSHLSSIYYITIGVVRHFARCSAEISPLSFIISSPLTIPFGWNSAYHRLPPPCLSISGMVELSLLRIWFDTLAEINRLMIRRWDIIDDAVEMSFFA